MINSQEAELSVITSCLINPKRVDECADVISINDFHSPIMRDCWAWIASQAASGGEIEVIGLSEQLDSLHPNDETSLIWLSEMVRNHAGSANAVHYAKAVHDKAQRRRLQAVAEEIGGMAGDIHQDFGGIVDAAQSRVSGLLGPGAESVGVVSDWLTEFVDDLEAKLDGRVDPMGILYNIPDVDQKTSGLHKKDLVILAGESGMGKTVAACHILESVSMRQNKPAIMFQLEMDRGPLLRRVIGSYSGVPLALLKDPKAHKHSEHWFKLEPAFARLKEAKLVIDDRPGLTMAQMRGAAKRWKQQFGELGVIIIDHAGIVGIEDKSMSREQQIAEVSRQGKIMAKDLDTTVILLAQINRDNKVRKDKRPILSDLRESASLQHNADVVMFVYRDEVYHPDTDAWGIMEFIIAKQRDGEVGTGRAVCDLSRSQLKPMTGENIADYRRENQRENNVEVKHGQEFSV